MVERHTSVSANPSILHPPPPPTPSPTAWRFGTALTEGSLTTEASRPLGLPIYISPMPVHLHHQWPLDTAITVDCSRKHSQHCCQSPGWVLNITETMGPKNRQFIAVTTKQHKWRTHTYTLSSGSISWINNIILIFQKLHNGPHHRVWNWEKTLNYIQSNSLSLFKYFFKNCFTILIFILFLFFGHTLLHVGS